MHKVKRYASPWEEFCERSQRVLLVAIIVMIPLVVAAVVLAYAALIQGVVSLFC